MALYKSVHIITAIIIYYHTHRGAVPDLREAGETPSTSRGPSIKPIILDFSQAHA